MQWQEHSSHKLCKPLKGQMERGFLLYGGVCKTKQNLEWGSGMSRWCDRTVEREMSSLAVSQFSGGAVKEWLYILVLAQVEVGSEFWVLG